MFPFPYYELCLSILPGFDRIDRHIDELLVQSQAVVAAVCTFKQSLMWFVRLARHLHSCLRAADAILTSSYLLEMEQDVMRLLYLVQRHHRRNFVHINVHSEEAREEIESIKMVFLSQKYKQYAPEWSLHDIDQHIQEDLQRAQAFLRDLSESNEERLALLEELRYEHGDDPCTVTEEIESAFPTLHDEHYRGDGSSTLCNVLTLLQEDLPSIFNAKNIPQPTETLAVIRRKLLDVRINHAQLTWFTQHATNLLVSERNFSHTREEYIGDLNKLVGAHGPLGFLPILLTGNEEITRFVQRHQAVVDLADTLPLCRDTLMAAESLDEEGRGRYIQRPIEDPWYLKQILEPLHLVPSVGCAHILSQLQSLVLPPDAPPETVYFRACLIKRLKK